MPPIAWIGLGVALVIVLIFLERRRQVRNLRARGERVNERPDLMGVGFLELQRHLEPGRNVEILQQQVKGEESGETEADDETET